MSVDVFRLNAAGRWELEGYGCVVELVSVGARFAIEELYLMELVSAESCNENAGLVLLGD
jgi:hypothetical protein